MPDDPKPAESSASASNADEPAARSETPAETTEAGASSGSIVPPEIEIDLLKRERDNLKDQLLRALAEAENIRKRAERDKADIAKFAISRFANDIVNVTDSFQHAIQAVSTDAAEKDPALKSFLEGVTLAERAFLATLERHGIKQINPVGEQFNPYQHHAASEEENPNVPAGAITKVYQVGYILDERVLRPAMVVVARGGKKPSAEESIKPANENTVVDDEGKAGEAKNDGAEQKAG